MFLVGLISWWYGRGWLTHLQRVGSRLSTTIEFFSIGQLAATVFAPFRQISASSRAGGGLSGAAQAVFDSLLSRFIGGFIRLFTIAIGLVVIVLQALYEAIVVVLWWLVPLFPIIGFIVFAIGWVPVWR